MSGTRFEVHINSNSYSELQRLQIENLQYKESQQILRIFNLFDPSLRIVMVLPFNIDQDIIEYYYKILKLQKVQNVRERLFFIQCQLSDKFHRHLPLCKQVLYCQKTIKKIKKIINNYKAYLVPGVPSLDDIKVGYQLEIPVFMGNPQKHIQLNNKSRSKQLFEETGLPVPMGTYELFELSEVIYHLTTLIFNNPEIKVWLLKIDNQIQS